MPDRAVFMFLPPGFIYKMCAKGASLSIFLSPVYSFLLLYRLQPAKGSNHCMGGSQVRQDNRGGCIAF